MIFVGTCVAGNGDTYRSVALPSLQRVLEPTDNVFTTPGDAGIAKAYNGFIAEARAHVDCEALVLVHDDVEIIDPNFRAKILAAIAANDVGVVGVVGATGLQSIEWWTGRAKVGRVHETRGPIDFGRSWGDVDVIDGLLMVLAPRAYRTLAFDEESCPDFHGYDVDYCLNARAAGLRVCVIPIDMIHRTKGGYGDQPSFDRAAERLGQKWLGVIRQPTTSEKFATKFADGRASARHMAGRAKVYLAKQRHATRTNRSRGDLRPSPVLGRPSGEPRCPVCNWSGSSEPTESDAGARLITCPDCGTGLTWPPPHREVTGPGLWEEMYGNARLKRRQTWFNEARQRVEWLQLYAPEGCLLEVGCGTGEFLRTAEDAGFEAYGVEPSAWAAQHAAALGVRAEAGFLSDWMRRYPGLRPDIVAMWHVLEHLPEPREFLQELVGLMADRALLVLEVPNYASTAVSELGPRWLGGQPEDHCFHYTPRSLARLLDSEGFEVMMCLPMSTRLYSSRSDWNRERNTALLDRRSWPPLDLLRAVARAKGGT